MAQGGGIPGFPLALIAAGGVLVYSGVENVSAGDILRSVAKGKKPVPGPAEFGQLNSGQSGGGTLTGPNSQIAQDAMQYAGHAYHYGGYEADPAGWDCSSFCNWVLGHDLGLTLPGGVRGYNGSYHGPAVAQYQLWTGATRISSGEAAAGDLVLYTTVHMGIVTGGGQFISALNPATGTKVLPVSEGPGPANYLRVK